MKSKLKPVIAAALLVVGASANAAPLVSETCGTLPNTNWSWVITPSSSVVFGEISYSGNSGNGTADVTTTNNIRCDAYNPGGALQTDRSHTVVGESSIVNQQVCFQSPNKDDIAGDLCR